MPRWLVALGTLAAVFPFPTQAGHYDFGDSLADRYLRSRIQIRVLQMDDAADGACRDRHFMSAKIARSPEEARPRPGVVERKWLEYWRLERCGGEIGYWVFVTDLADGGAYFSVEIAR